MNPQFVKYIAYPLHERLWRRDTLKYLKELEQVQWYSLSDIQKYQLEKLRRLLRHCYENVPYYRGLFKRLKIVLADFRSLEDFSVVPLLTKEIIRGNLNQLKASNFKNRLIPYNTSGSTGEPLRFFIDNIRAAYTQALLIRTRRWWGIDIGSRGLHLWGGPLERSKLDMLKNVRDYFININFISVFKMNEEYMKRCVKIIKGFKPQYIYGYTTSVYLFSLFLERNKIDLKDLGIKAIFVTAEMLYDFQKELIEKSFGCPVVNQYSARDGGIIASQCPCGNMHLSENIYAEFINNGKLIPDEGRGEIIITQLDLYGMPLIRYKIGDIAAPLKRICSCGRNGPLLSNIEGRILDFIITEDARAVSSISLMYILREQEGIVQFRVIQKEKNYFEIYLIADDNFTKVTEKIICDKFKGLLGKNIIIKFIFSESLEVDKTGKFKYIVSECSNAVIANMLGK